MAVSSTGAICILPIQDDFQGIGNPNIYQVIQFFGKNGADWSAEGIVDHTAHSAASTRQRLLEQSDLYVDASDDVHVFYKEFLGADGGTVSSIMHLTGSLGSWTTRTIDPGPFHLNWVKMIEVGETRYLVASSYDRLYVMNETATAYREIVLPSDISGIYPYVATRQGGTADTESYVDILLLNGRGDNYPDGANYYVRIAKADIAF